MDLGDFVDLLEGLSISDDWTDNMNVGDLFLAVNIHGTPWGVCVTFDGSPDDVQRLHAFLREKGVPMRGEGKTAPADKGGG